VKAFPEEIKIMKIVHLTASTFFGGPERQMLGLARALPPDIETHFLSFPEGGRSKAFLGAARRAGFTAQDLTQDTPRFRAASAEIAAYLETIHADILFCHGYKANLLGRPAARRRKIPAVAVSRGWTAESLRVRLYEALDRFHLRWMDQIVCVSEAQAARVRRTGVRPDLVHVIANAVDVERFDDPDPLYRNKLQRYFRQPRTIVVGAAGRLSPEKGFDVLINAAERVLRTEKSVGFVLFGDGPCKAALAKQINSLGLAGSVILAGFRTDLDRFLPHFDLLAVPSHTEGLPNVVLEAFAATVPVVATTVGGIPEVVEDEISGYLVPANDPDAMAERICDAISSEEQLNDMGMNGRQRILDDYSFTTQAKHYCDLLARIVTTPPQDTPEPPVAETPALEAVSTSAPAASDRPDVPTVRQVAVANPMVPLALPVAPEDVVGTPPMALPVETHFQPVPTPPAPRTLRVPEEPPSTTPSAHPVALLVESDDERLAHPSEMQQDEPEAPVQADRALLALAGMVRG
jgi:glycosyltransferase involved in cell wall biosynthesis